PVLQAGCPRVTHPSAANRSRMPEAGSKMKVIFIDEQSNFLEKSKLLTSGIQLLSARLACIRHAASVRPEPRSNSPKTVCLNEQRSFILAFLFRGLKHCFFPLHRLFCSVFKEQIICHFLVSNFYIISSSVFVVNSFFDSCSTTGYILYQVNLRLSIEKNNFFVVFSS